MIKERTERGYSLVVCDKNQFIFVELAQKKTPYYSSRIMILEMKDDRLVLKTTVENFWREVGQLTAMRFYGYIGSHALLIGMSEKNHGMVYIIDYNTESGEFSLLEDQKLIHEEYYPCKITRSGNQFYYTGQKGKVMKLRSEF